MRSRPIGTPLSDEEAATVVRFEMAPDAPESWAMHERVTEAIREAWDERTWQQMTLCPNGCGCRKQTDDPDAHDCGCDGPCCYAEDWWDGRTDAEAYADAAIAVMRGDDA